ncbi:MAG: tetratricopeptide repeat protein [Phycisphaerales bacterium]|nr:MAG: tetratricopeptide repeat protein [Phycisphaerales bacterium]
MRGALYYHDRDRGHHGRGRHYYGRGYYYHGYRPIHYYGCDYYRPWGGYTYSTFYYPEPYVYRFYDTDVYYVGQSDVSDDVYEVTAPSEVEVGGEPLPPTGTYRALTAPEEVTLLGQGNAAFAAGRYDEARRLYVSAMLADERDGYAKFLYALVNFALGDYEVAAMAIRRALLTTADLIDYPVDVRSLYPEAALFETQLEGLTRFAGDHPNDRGALLLLGYLQYAGGHPKPALSVLDRLVKIDPDDDVVSLLRDAVSRVSR